MAGTLLVGAEGVILAPRRDTPYASSRVIQSGIEIVRQLTQYRLAVVANTEDISGVEWFCRFNGLAKANVIGIAPEDVGIEPAEAQWNMIQRERARGPLNLVLTSFVGTFQHCKSTRQSVLLYGRQGSLGSLDAQPTWDDLATRSIARREAIAFKED